MADFIPRGGDFKRGPKRFGGKPSIGSRGGKPGFEKKTNWADRGGARSDDRSTTLYKAICSKCGNECEVPFRPVNGKPVFCRNCFVKTGDTDTRGRAGDRYPSNDRYPKRDFGPASTTRSEFPKSDNAPIMKQLEILNSKLDRLIGAIESMGALTPVATESNSDPVTAATKATKVKKEKKGYPKKKAE